VLLTHKTGVVAADAAGTAQAAFGAYPMEGRTGRGDTCTAAFLVARQSGASLDEAARFAAEITTRKMQYPGPYRGDKELVAKTASSNSAPRA
jgi:sugar/nucleoside kinase (ribokinase family)